jgi:hypothetical protein
VIDRADPRADRVLDPVRALGMGHDEHAGGCCLLDQSLELGRSEMRVTWVVAGRQDAARCGDLDDVRPGPMQLTDLPPDLVDTVDDAGRPTRMRTDERHLRARWVPVVAVAAGLAEHGDRDLEPGTSDQAIDDGLLDPEIGAAGIADRRDPDRKRRLQVPGRLVELHRERPLDRTPEVDVRDRDVGVAIEHAGQDRPAADIDLLVAIQPGPETDDPVALEGHVRGGRIGAGPVEHPTSPQHDPRHASSSWPSPGSSRARNRSAPLVASTRRWHQPSSPAHADASISAPAAAASANSSR